MAYNPYSDVKNIYHYKWMWDEANTAGDDEKKKAAADAAASYYQKLRDNGYSNVADELEATDFTGAKPIHDYYAKAGAVKTKNYLYDLGKAYGMSNEDVDKIVGWADTGEVTIGGKNIGAPDSVIDGVSYWHDTTKLDEAFNDYIERSGTTRAKSNMVNQENENLFKSLYGEYDSLKNTNPFETEEGKAILSKYSLAGLQGRDNAAASGSASNGGNIDSFSAANAMRQQASLINQGQMAVLEAYQQKLDHARNLLSDIGVHIDRVYNQDENTKQAEFDRSETAKNNETARLVEKSNVTGYIPEEWSRIQDDPFLGQFVDENGKLKKEVEGMDFQHLYDEAVKKGDTKLANNYAILRGLKIFGNLKEFGQYLDQGNIAVYEKQRTAPFTLEWKKSEDAKEIAEGDNATQLKASENSLEASKYSTDASVQNNVANNATEKAIAEMTLNNENAEKVAKAEKAAYLRAQYDALLKLFKPTEKYKRGFVEKVLGPIFEKGEDISLIEFQQLIAANTAKYNIDVDDTERICEQLGFDSSWVSKAYRDRTNADGPAENGREGNYGGMIPIVKK